VRSTETGDGASIRRNFLSMNLRNFASAQKNSDAEIARGETLGSKISSGENLAVSHTCKGRRSAAVATFGSLIDGQFEAITFRDCTSRVGRTLRAGELISGNEELVQCHDR
jgi:hypothetical protein